MFITGKMANTQFRLEGNTPGRFPIAMVAAPRKKSAT